MEFCIARIRGRRIRASYLLRRLPPSIFVSKSVPYRGNNHSGTFLARDVLQDSSSSSSSRYSRCKKVI